MISVDFVMFVFKRLWYIISILFLNSTCHTHIQPQEPAEEYRIDFFQVFDIHFGCTSQPRIRMASGTIGIGLWMRLVCLHMAWLGLGLEIGASKFNQVTLETEGGVSGAPGLFNPN